MTKLMAELRTPGFNAELTLYSSGERYALAMNRTYMSAPISRSNISLQTICGDCRCDCDCESGFGNCRCCNCEKGCERTVLEM
jgi:hypothetical protein